MKNVITKIVFIGLLAMNVQHNYAQVGIGTTTPQQSLHIFGANPLTNTIRVDALSNANQPLFNNNIDLAPLAVNGNGDIVLGGPTFLSQTIYDVDETTFLDPAITVTTTDGAQTFEDLLGGTPITITLTQQTLVEINFSIAAAIDDGAGGPITDGIARFFGVLIYVNGNFENWFTELYSNTNADGALSGDLGGGTTDTYTSGPFMLNGSTYVTLPAGTHTLDIFGTTSGATRVDTAFGTLIDHVETSVEFGGNGFGSTLKIIKHN